MATSDLNRPTGPSGPGLSRRRALTLLGGTGLVGLTAAACRQFAPETATPPTSAAGPTTTTAAGGTATTTPSGVCVLSPELTEGPYYLSGEAIRQDVTEGRPGVPLALVFTVVDAGPCTPVRDASVEIWHADAGGTYSGFGSATAERTFLRGAQVTGDDGVARFTTIYPGWYPGRATHIHLKVHVGGDTVHTGQVFFDEAVNDAVYAQDPYRDHTGTRTHNGSDGIYRQGGAQSLLTLTPAAGGYQGAINLGVNA
jgi:protocatechuate 3,4-dioxygenase beta subunit